MFQTNTIEQYTILTPRSNKNNSPCAKVASLLREYYQKIDENGAMPFPDEESLGISISDDQAISLGVGSKLAAFTAEPKKPDSTVIRISFPEDYGTALVLAEHIPRKLIEACLLKIRHYLLQYGNKEYALHKLLVQLPGKEPSLKNIMNKIQIQPLDCYGIIAEGGEFSYLFWAYFCGLIKDDIKKRKDRFTNEHTAIQAVHVIEAFNGYYRSIAVKAKEKELAFKRLELNLAKPPFFYTMDQIVKFTGAKGLPLLGQYSTKELSEYLTKMTSKNIENKLPELLIFSGPGAERYFILKNKIPQLCTMLLAEAREKVKKTVKKHWQYLLKNYETEPAMETDKDFERRLIQFTETLCPMLNFLLEDPKLQLVYEEIDQSKEFSSSRIFVKGVQAPYSSLFLLKRKEILEDIRLFLPFWHSIPAFVAICSFSKQFSRKQAV
ncbi:MAG: hypothetical protein LBI14_02095 [Treponema sp.]|jgi:hypothetical protein|nr:hypothetical protein [Treponema sp.]